MPWRFYQMSLPNEAISGYQFQTSMKSWTFQCPAGYTAVSGGLTGGDAPNGIYRLLDTPPRGRHVPHHAPNGALSGTAISLGAVCVWLDDVGAITTVTTVETEFARNGRRAGGILRCPEGSGTSVLSAGVDWSNGDTGKTIDFSSPITDGTNLFTGWYVAGYSPSAGVLESSSDAWTHRCSRGVRHRRR